MNISDIAKECGFKWVVEPPCDYYKATNGQLEAFAKAVIEAYKVPKDYTRVNSDDVPISPYTKELNK